MGAQGYKPTQSQIYNISTTNQTHVQIWQELKMLRFSKGKKAFYGKKVTAPYIDQAKMYFNDACESNWKSSGLLYYYSFLNLAKALIVSKRYLSGAYLASSNVYHGLSAQPQSIDNIIDFEIDIHPRVSRGKRNIFAIFYKSITGVDWPFGQNIKVKVGDIIGYCFDIEHESENFYGLEKQVIPVFSLIRYDNKEVWFEFMCHNNDLRGLLGELPNEIYTLVPNKLLTRQDAFDWKNEFNTHPSQFSNNTLINFKHINYAATDLQKEMREVIIDAKNNLSDFFAFPSENRYPDHHWLFIRKLNVQGQSLIWKPILSNYLFAFVLSTILRYYPFLFYSDTEDSFIAEAWCNQSAVSTLRQFLMDFTNPSIRLN